MSRITDPLAPSDLIGAHKVAICQHREILQLRRGGREFVAEMRSPPSTVKNARKPFPQLYLEHEAVNKTTGQTSENPGNRRSRGGQEGLFLEFACVSRQSNQATSQRRSNEGYDTDSCDGEN